MGVGVQRENFKEGEAQLEESCLEITSQLSRQRRQDREEPALHISLELQGSLPQSRLSFFVYKMKGLAQKDLQVPPSSNIL